MTSTPMIVTSGNDATRQCCHCGRVLGEEQWAVYKGRVVLWACSSDCRTNYHTTVAEEPV